jgi:hypothetical protein
LTGRAGILLSSINAKWIHPSLAVRLLKAGLEELEENSEIPEFNLRQPLSEKTEPILAARPRIFAMSVSIWNHRAALELLCRAILKGKNTPKFIDAEAPDLSRLPSPYRLYTDGDLARFGRNWGIDRKELMKAVSAELP